MRTSEWVVEGRDESAAELAPHVVSRVGTVLRNHCDRYDGVRVQNGNVVFGAAHQSHLVSVIIGPDQKSGRLAVRVLSNGNSSAKLAAAAFPMTTLVVLLLTVKAEIPGGALLGLVVGLLAGLVAAYATFTLTNRFGLGARGDRGRTAAIAQDVHRELQRSLSSLELELNSADVLLAGLDGNPLAGDSDDWRRIFDSAVSALAG